MQEILKGPFAQENQKIKILYLLFFVGLTSITEVGGILIWPFMAIPYYDYPKIKNVQTIGYALCFYILSSWLLVPFVASRVGMNPLP